uniref:Uncharacterized protein n=1 Tax=Nelumbo nucifera TaxID=4432 RepID=A0A822XEU8_NELNU|nr:TPA_asm: hypothetical protein HUJ06_021427 [Nelumbo nucifera]
MLLRSSSAASAPRLLQPSVDGGGGSGCPGSVFWIRWALPPPEPGPTSDQEVSPF